MFYTCYSHVLHALCVYFSKKGPVRLKFPNLKSVTTSFAFKQTRKVFLFSRYLEQINCWTRMVWHKLPAKQNSMINLQIYESRVKAFTCLANWLDIFSICHVKRIFSYVLAKLRHLWRPSFKLIGGKQGKQFSCVFSLGEYFITKLSKKCSAFFFRMHFT